MASQDTNGWQRRQKTDALQLLIKVTTIESSAKQESIIKRNYCGELNGESRWKWVAKTRFMRVKNPSGIRGIEMRANDELCRIKQLSKGSPKSQSLNCLKWYWTLLVIIPFLLCQVLLLWTYPHPYPQYYSNVLVLLFFLDITVAWLRCAGAGCKICISVLHTGWSIHFCQN